MKSINHKSILRNNGSDHKDDDFENSLIAALAVIRSRPVKPSRNLIDNVRAKLRPVKRSAYSIAFSLGGWAAACVLLIVIWSQKGHDSTSQNSINFSNNSITSELDKNIHVRILAQNPAALKQNLHQYLTNVPEFGTCQFLMRPSHDDILVQPPAVSPGSAPAESLTAQPVAFLTSNAGMASLEAPNSSEAIGLTVHASEQFMTYENGKTPKGGALATNSFSSNNKYGSLEVNQKNSIKLNTQESVEVDGASALAVDNLNTVIVYDSESDKGCLTVKFPVDPRIDHVYGLYVLVGESLSPVFVGSIKTTELSNNNKILFSLAAKGLMPMGFVLTLEPTNEVSQFKNTNVILST